MPVDKPTKMGVLAKFKQEFLNITGGSGDPEKEDCPESAEAAFKKVYPRLKDFKDAMVGLHEKLIALDPSWRPTPVIQHVMPESQEHVRCHQPVAAWLL